MAVVVAAAVVEDAAAAADGGDKENKPMNSNSTLTRMNKATAYLIVSFGCLATTIFAAPAAKQDAASGKQEQFDDPKKAAESLVEAAANWDQQAITKILGPDSADIVSSEDEVGDKQRGMEFAQKAKEKLDIKNPEKDANHAIVVVGKDNFELPIPLVKNKGKWTFDTKVGREEILNRRIGANELTAINICRGFDEAQHEYAEQKHDGAMVNQYAQKIISSPGKQDGLAWQTADGKWEGPVGEEAARALEEGYTKGEPFHGYLFKVLKGQGPAAPMGEMDFMVGGAMIGGFALAAAPAQYRVTGVKTFIVGADGVVYEKDLGKDTLKEFQAMERYNPDKTWKATEDDVPDEDETSDAPAAQ
ncbi:MAG: DUF2950 domain-containing protein [Chthoniobacterales bacterium]